MLLFGKVNYNSIKELMDLIIEDNRIINFNSLTNTLSEQVSVLFFFRLS